MKNSTAVRQNAQRLLSDLRALGTELEKVLENSASEVTENALGRIRDQFRSAQDRFSNVYGMAKEKTLAGAKYTDKVVRRKPYQSIAAAAGIGLLAGFLVGRAMGDD